MNEEENLDWQVMELLHNFYIDFHRTSIQPWIKRRNIKKKYAEEIIKIINDATPSST